jgi:aldehyde dehydrogenase family 7 protein A1
LPAETEVVQQETFAPIVYILETSSLAEAINLNNGVEQGLSSSLFTKSIGNVFQVYIYIQLTIKIYLIHI